MGSNNINDLNDRINGYVSEFNRNDRDKGQDAKYIPNEQAAKWIIENVPLVELPDKIMERAYYFRWWTYRKHIRLTDDGFVITEFLPDVPWAGKHNTISCSAGHHFYEGRWIRNRQYLDEYLNFWFNGGGSIRSYSFWVADAAYQWFLVTGNTEPLLRHYEDFIENYNAWEKERGDESGLFWQVDDREGMELSMGGTGLRPSINSYMYAEARAITAMARMFGDKNRERLFDEKAKNIKVLIKSMLWDSHEKFFKTFVNEKHRQIQREKYGNDNAYMEQPLGLSNVTELFGYVPWYYGVMDDDQTDDFNKAWQYITDADYFYAPRGLSTAPISHPDFMRTHQHECAWDGPSWPYATCQALGAMARMLRNNNKTDAPVNALDFMNLTSQYAAAHRLNGEGSVDWIDENYDPFSGEWIARKLLYERNDPNKNRGQYYNHSTYCDLIISDVIGLQCNEDNHVLIHPMAVNWPYFYMENIFIRGKELKIIFDKDGRHYGMGVGLTVTENGNVIEQKPELGRMEFSLTS